MSLLTGLVQAVIEAVTWFPEAFQPGIFGVLLLVAFWGLTTRGRLVWGTACRATAVVVDLAVGCLLLPDYVLTSARRRAGQAPGAITRVSGDVLERVLDGAAGLYDRHAAAAPGAPPPPAPQSPAAGMSSHAFPWKVAAAVLFVPVAAWVLRDQAPTSPIAEWVDRSWTYWSDLVSWAQR